MEAEQLEVDGLVIDDGAEDAPEVEPEAEETEESPETDKEESEESDEGDKEAEKPKAKVEFTPEQQEAVNQIAAKTAERYLKKLEQAEAEKQQYLEQINKLQPKDQKDPGRPEIPPIPDPFDDDYEQKVTKRDEALRDAAVYDAVMAAKGYQEQTQKQQQEAERQEQLRKDVESYSNRAKRAGISEAELQMAGQIVSPELSESLVTHILTDDKGPLITKYLAANMDELAKVKAMDPMRAAVYLATEIKPKAAGKPATRPPKPTEPVEGAGFPEGKIGPPGLVIE